MTLEGKFMAMPGALASPPVKPLTVKDSNGIPRKAFGAMKVSVLVETLRTRSDSKPASASSSILDKGEAIKVLQKEQ